MIRAHGRSERGVSAVIGVVLIVALTVIIAAIAAQPLLTLASDVTKGAQAGATVEFEKGEAVGDGTVTVQFVDNIDAEDLEVNVTVRTNPSRNSVNVTSGSKQLDEPGDSVTLTEDPSNIDNDVRVNVLVTGIRQQQRTVVLDRTGTI